MHSKRYRIDKGGFLLWIFKYLRYLVYTILYSQPAIYKSNKKWSSERLGSHFPNGSRFKLQEERNFRNIFSTEKGKSELLFKPCVIVLRKSRLRDLLLFSETRRTIKAAPRRTSPWRGTIIRTIASPVTFATFESARYAQQWYSKRSVARGSVMHCEAGATVTHAYPTTMRQSFQATIATWGRRVGYATQCLA